MQYDTRARLLAVEVLLADPETLGNDALETDLYLLREQLAGTAGEPRSARADIARLAGSCPLTLATYNRSATPTDSATAAWCGSSGGSWSRAGPGRGPSVPSARQHAAARRGGTR